VDLYQDFAALTIHRLAQDWELSRNDIDSTLMELEILRASWRTSLTRDSFHL
jgi:hypothetical protein